MKIIEYNQAEVYNFSPADVGRIVYFFDEGMLVLSEDELALSNTGTKADFDSVLTYLWSNHRIEEYNESESD